MKGMYWAAIVGMIMLLPDLLITRHWMYYVTLGLAIYSIIVCIAIDRLAPKLTGTTSEILFDKNVKKQIHHMALRFGFVTVSLALIDVLFLGIYVESGDFRQWILYNDVELILEGGPPMMAVFAVSVTIELLLLVMSQDRKDKDRS